MQFFYIILHSQFTICGFTRHAMCGYTLIHIYLYTPTFHSAIYVIMHHGAWLYVYFYIKGAVLRTAALTLHHVVTRMVIPLHVWLYIKHMVIYTLTFHCIACGYTSRYTVIPVISRIYTSYTRMSSFHTYSNIVLYVSFSKYVSTLFLYVHTVDYQTTSVQIVHRLPNDVEIS